MNEQKISAVHTPCKKCVFAEYTDKTQTDCHLDYINKYIKNDVKIFEAYDEEKEFFIIDGKKCIGYRENKWFEKRNLGDVSIQDKIANYKASNYAHYVAVINLKDLDLKQLEKICHNIKACQIKPQKIVLIRHLDENKGFHYKDIENIFNAIDIDYPWRIQTMLDEELPYEYVLYDIIKNNKSCRFLLSIAEDSDILDKLVCDTNKRVYEELDNFCACGNSSKKIVFYSSTVYRYAFETGKDILNDTELYTVV